MSDEFQVEKNLRVLELYSGIGGMHWALKESGVPFKIVMAVDINTTANKIYSHNFPQINLNSFGIEKLTLKKLDSLRPNAILMSPPCQPFSRVGKKGDCDDVRTKSFLHIMQLLRQMDEKPRYILVENVKGFDTSRTRQILVETLNECRYSFQEYLLTPLQFGIPNSRLRYYMIAKHKDCRSPLTETSQILDSLPQTPIQNNGNNQDKPPSEMHQNTEALTCSVPCSTLACPNTLLSNHERKNCDSQRQKETGGDIITSHVRDKVDIKINSQTFNKSNLDTDDKTNNYDEVISEGARNSFGQDSLISKKTKPSEFDKFLDAGRNMRYCEELDDLINDQSRPLSEFLEEGDENCFNHLLVSDKNLRQFVVMDIVLPQLKKSTCFTKRYGHYVEGAGSLVQMSTSTEDTRAASLLKSQAVELKNKNDWGEDELSIVRKLKLRYFSPREVANLLCFPKQFDFPDDVYDIQKYRCLGNSLNVHVVARLIQILTQTDL